MLLDTTNIETTPTVKRWTNEELQAQFKKCEEWKDPDQWDALGTIYFTQGYLLNAGVCFKRADALRGVQ